MSTTYFAPTKIVSQYAGPILIPKLMWDMKERWRRRDCFVVGTRFANGLTSALQVYDSYDGYVTHNKTLGFETDLTREDFEIIIDSGKPYYSKWGEGRPLHIFDTRTRFVWPSDDARDLWKAFPKLYRQKVPLLNNNSASEPKTLEELMESVYGENPTMAVLENEREGTVCKYG